ncbi:diguanylate cyclase [Pseudoroseicyclus tamaricis]|uniref:diguanylate cyclase n=1 Tax=Pseudoroseicyclus tamaricis TaxID=2705421 RepID=UPI0014331CDD|nr:diguanylate cyclase [Pseudoroseicyclus tamaricis]
MLIFDPTVSSRILTRAALAEAQYNLVVAESSADAQVEMMRGRPDLILLGVVAPAAGAFAFLAGLRADPQRRGIPVIAVGRLSDPSLRLAVLRAGADDLCDRPVDPVLLQAQVRRLLRRSDSLAELCLREETHRALGFAEEGEEFLQPGRVSVVVPEGQAVLPAVVPVLDRLPGGGDVLDPRSLLTRIGSGDAADLFVIDAAAEGLRPGELFRLIAELRSRASTRHSVQIAIVPPDMTDMAAMALDLGVDDLVSARVRPAELMHRLKALLLQKHRADRAREKLRRGVENSVTDPLTGLYNRRYALPALKSVTDQAARSGRMAAVMVLDIDHFKEINDRFGHATGDKVLEEVARRLAARVRVGDMVARIGGEEFLVVMPETDAEAAAEAAERLRSGIEDRPFESNREGCPAPPPVRVTLSIGVALGAGERPGEPTLFERADAALYSAKLAGRNMVSLSRPAA